MTPSAHIRRRRVQELVSRCNEFHQNCRGRECKKLKRQPCNGVDSRRNCCASTSTSTKGRSSNSKNNCTFFCLDCGGRPLCQNCSKVDHTDHDTVQAFYTTHKRAIGAVGPINKYLDPSRIQKLKNNNKQVILILSRQMISDQKENNNSVNNNNNNNNNNKVCKTCMFKFVMHDPTEDFDFCSIQCLMMERGDNARMISDGKKAPLQRSGSSRRKQSNPQRAPFF